MKTSELTGAALDWAVAQCVNKGFSGPSQWVDKVAPYTCQFCGQPSYLEPVDQTPPPDYCHPEDHGEPE